MMEFIDDYMIIKRPEQQALFLGYGVVQDGSGDGCVMAPLSVVREGETIAVGRNLIKEMTQAKKGEPVFRWIEPMPDHRKPSYHHCWDGVDKNEDARFMKAGPLTTGKDVGELRLLKDFGDGK